ncbi:hypothetical protein C4D60_Mb06t02200 [Musa balbisiana]|uniref:Uncharacterized protein n=1 Tax=Musa balbisiana TaxID=52838 RepID=A0A4S8IKQ2_MUSBA|nr:hypothetical protein C4D60_Mb06t02200 [Musa balbisiana]
MVGGVWGRRGRGGQEGMEWWSWKWCLSLGVTGACMLAALKVLHLLWWRPRKLEEHFARQGIRGPRYRFFTGCVKEMVGLMLEASSKPMMPQNSHNILPRVLPFYHHWKKIYGARFILLLLPPLFLLLWFSGLVVVRNSDLNSCTSPPRWSSSRGSTFLLWFGPTPRLTVADPDLIRDVFLSRSDAFERYEAHPLVRRLEGEGLVSLRGEKWARHRKVLTPTFHMENLKLLIPFVGKTVLFMVEKLPSSGEEVEIDVSEWFQTVTEDAITRTTFGRSYDDGMAVFQLQTQQMAFAAEAFSKVFIPATVNTDSFNSRALHSHSRAATLHPRLQLLIPFVGKTVLFMVEKLPSSGEEVEIDVSEWFQTVTEDAITRTTFGRSYDDGMAVFQLQTQQMAFAAEAFSKVFIPGYRFIPTKKNSNSWKLEKEIKRRLIRLIGRRKELLEQEEEKGKPDGDGTELLIPIMGVHHDAGLWGTDVAEFNPTRFADGASRAARHPTAFIPFGLGARMCIGQNLAVLEAKLTVAILLQRLAFRLSPSYVHAPTVLMLLHPQYGAPILFRSLPQPSHPS